MNKTKKRTCRPVMVYDKSGKLVKEYESVRAAAEDLGIKEYRVRNLINDNKARHGLTYRLGRNKPYFPPLDDESSDPDREAWEGPNGIFNIKGWAKMPLFA